MDTTFSSPSHQEIGTLLVTREVVLVKKFDNLWGVQEGPDLIGSEDDLRVSIRIVRLGVLGRPWTLL